MIDKSEVLKAIEKSLINYYNLLNLSQYAKKTDLTNYALKEDIPTVTNDLTNELKANYDTAYTHSQSAHAPSNAQVNADITKAEIEAKLTGNITTHTHSQYLTEHQDISGKANVSGQVFTGTVEAPVVKATSYFYTPALVNEGDLTKYYHRLNLGYANHDYWEFHEYGGDYRFYKNTAGTDDGKSLIANITSTGSNFVGQLKEGGVRVYSPNNKPTAADLGITIPEAYVLPVANQNTLGGIKVGAGLSITADGILSATGGGTADSIAWENVVGKPTKLSEFANDSDFTTKTYVDGQISAIELTPGPKGDKGDKGDKGEKGDTGNDGLTTSISVNGTTYNHVNGTITLPDYPNKYDNSNKYDNPYKNKGSVVVKMQTHCHTTNSDGNGTLEQVINAYKSKGFNAICITDHNMITDTNAYNTNDFITILGTEHAVGHLGSLTAHHMNVINTNYVSEKETPFEVYQDYKSNKSFTVKNHPHDLRHENHEVSYDNGEFVCDAIEIFNGKRQTGYLYAFWRAIETGHKIKHIATDDFHEASTTVSSTGYTTAPSMTGWVKLYCKEFSKQGIMDSLYKGSYISCIEHDMDIESGDDYIRATAEILCDFRFVDKNGLVLKEEKNVMTSEYTFNGFEELIMVISQPVNNPTKYAISQCIFNNDVFGKEHKQVINDKLLCEKIVTDKFAPKYHIINSEDYTDYKLLHIKNLELYGKTTVDYTNHTFKHSRAIMAFNDKYLALSNELLKQGDYIKDGYLYTNTDEIVVDDTWNIVFYKKYTNVNQFRIELQDKIFKPRGDRIFMCNYAPRISDYGSSNPVVGLYLSNAGYPRYFALQLNATEFPDVNTLKTKLRETPLKILYSRFEPKVTKLPKEYYMDTLGANEINVITEADFSFDMVHNKDINAPEYGQVSKISMTLIPGEFAYDGTGDGISMNIDGTNYTLSNYNMRHYDYIKDNTIYKCGKMYSYNDFTVITKLKSTRYFRVEFPADATPDFIDSMVTGNEAMSEKESPFEKNGKTYLYIYYKDVPPYTQSNFPTLDNLKTLFAEKYPDFKVYFKYDTIGTENITLPQASITKDSIIKMNGKYESCLFKVN